jgi:hypothetical protein
MDSKLPNWPEIKMHPFCAARTPRKTLEVAWTTALEKEKKEKENGKSENAPF